LSLQHQRLSGNLSELHSLLSDDRVRQHQRFADTNQSSYKELVHFLKQYSKSLHDGEPLRHQRFTLEFILTYGSIACLPACARAPAPIACLARHSAVRSLEVWASEASWQHLAAVDETIQL
jgi:hypothetical protein